MNWKLTIEYDGTRYYGWQEQKGARTVAGEIRGAAESFLNQPADLIGAGRTDAGVHALAQVARLRSARRLRPIELMHGLNDRLPPDINVLSVEEAGPQFDPRRDALARYYLYQISTRRTAFAKKAVWWVKDRLNVEAMQQACAPLVGRHDFVRLCDKRAGEQSTVVVVEHAELGRDGDLILFRIGASHFLWKMVRRVTGALVEIGRGNLRPDGFQSLFDHAAASRAASAFDAAAHTAPPSGLFLERVVYRGEARPDALVPAIPVQRP
ncbi:MAG TPA: tRNA pseudouridine(38-40) synthase TruA [Blastocatellia bacterium]|nr:tRNA pseudouridine(38-40) synthase TruA [Blastocatellia bacterium]